MTTVAILPVSNVNGQKIYRAISGDKESTGRTAGEALDALAAQLGSDFSPFLIIQNFQPDWFFSAEQQQQLSELMSVWQTARNRGQSLSTEQQTELDNLVEAELKAATARSAAMVQQLNQ